MRRFLINKFNLKLSDLQVQAISGELCRILALNKKQLFSRSVSFERKGMPKFVHSCENMFWNRETKKIRTDIGI